MLPSEWVLVDAMLDIGVETFKESVFFGFWNILKVSSYRSFPAGACFDVGALFPSVPRPLFRKKRWWKSGDVFPLLLPEHDTVEIIFSALFF